MANLYVFEKGVRKAILQDFYRNEDVTIELPKDLSAVQYATKLYKKSPGVQKEIQLLEEKVLRLEKTIQEKEASLQQVLECKTLKELKSFHKKNTSKTNTPELPFHEFQLMGHSIRVGKNAKGNEALLRSHSHKDDWWLHAFEMAGSHVIIRRQGTKADTPKPVIEFAASLAAYFSKGRNRENITVMLTERKFVRKGKGLKPGQVLVDSFKTIMANPVKPEAIL